jgi:hypothetical protein
LEELEQGNSKFSSNILLSVINVIEGEKAEIVIVIGEHSQKDIIRGTINNAQENNSSININIFSSFLIFILLSYSISSSSSSSLSSSLFLFFSNFFYSMFFTLLIFSFLSSFFSSK